MLDKTKQTQHRKKRAQVVMEEIASKTRPSTLLRTRFSRVLTQAAGRYSIPSLRISERLLEPDHPAAGATADFKQRFPSPRGTALQTRDKGQRSKEKSGFTTLAVANGPVESQNSDE
jgi:hypothetical protein